MNTYDASAFGRFTRRVDRSGGPTACHPWIGGRDQEAGYGLMWYRSHQVLAHRMAWYFANGPIPEGMQVRHSCDNPSCCNVTHLALGTQADNMLDRIAHGAGYAHGEAHPRARLTEELIRKAADLRRQRWSWYRIADELGVERSTISRAVQHQGGLWNHLDVGDVPENRITDEILATAIHLHDEGHSWREVERITGIHRQSIRYALKTRGPSR